METKPKNTVCEHDWVASLEEAGLQVCAWTGCRETREAPSAELEPEASVVMVVVEDRRAA